MWAGIAAAGLPPSEPIGIIGIGGLSSLAVQFAKALGHQVVAIDDRSEGRDLATEIPLKADLVVDYNDAQAVEKIVSWTGKGGLAGAVICTDSFNKVGA